MRRISCYRIEHQLSLRIVSKFPILKLYVVLLFQIQFYRRIVILPVSRRRFRVKLDKFLTSCRIYLFYIINRHAVQIDAAIEVILLLQLIRSSSIDIIRSAIVRKIVQILFCHISYNPFFIQGARIPYFRGEKIILPIRDGHAGTVFHSRIGIIVYCIVSRSYCIHLYIFILCRIIRRYGKAFYPIGVA